MKCYMIVNEFLSSNSFNKIYEQFENAFNKMGVSFELLTNVTALKLLNTNGNGKPILFFDKDVFLAKQLEKCGYKCINSSKVIEICDDKAKTYIKLLNKVAMPKTILAPFTFNTVGYTNLNFISHVERELGYPMVVKQNKGSFGEQVYLVNNCEELIQIIKKIGSSEMLFQEYVKSSFGKDYRVYVVNGKVVASALRTNDSDFRSNVASGGSMKAVQLPTEYENLAIKCCEILGADFAGVDLLIGDNGPLVCEVNSNAHFTALAEITKVDVALSIVKHLLSLK